MSHLIFLPGASGSTEFWCPLIKNLPEEMTTQIIAYPAFANEPAHPDIHGFEQLQQYVLNKIDRPCILVAQSMGGIFAVAAALQKPELIQGLVLIATSGGIDLSQFNVADWRQSYAKDFLNSNNVFLSIFTNYYLALFFRKKLCKESSFFHLTMIKRLSFKHVA